MSMNKKIYQVFVSSTYTDLETERLKVIRDMLMNDFYPLGMESFPASSEEQLAFCKRMIDRSDYYVLIIGTRYGSETNNGLSYTEQEYDYAIEKEIPILAFVSADPENKPVKFLENETQREKYEVFKNRAMENRIVKYWNNADDLSISVIASLHAEIMDNPRVGLIRSDTIVDIPGIGKGLDTLGKENAALKEKIIKLNTTITEQNIKITEQYTTISTLRNDIRCIKNEIEETRNKKKKLNMDVVISGMYLKLTHSCLINQNITYTIPLDKLFENWGPYLYTNDSVQRAKNDMEAILSQIWKLPSLQISMESFNHIKMLLLGYDLIRISKEERGLRTVECITVTEEGNELLKELACNNIDDAEREGKV